MTRSPSNARPSAVLTAPSSPNFKSRKHCSNAGSIASSLGTSTRSTTKVRPSRITPQAYVDPPAAERIRGGQLHACSLCVACPKWKVCAPPRGYGAAVTEVRVRSGLATREVAAVAGVLGVVLLVANSWYGYHRDELYFRLLSKDLSWGYFDQLGPATPALIRASTGLLGDTVWALRVPAVLCAVATVVLTALLAAELGAGRRGQVLAAIGTAVSAFPVMIGHTMLTSALDVPLTMAALLFAARALVRGNPRWWAAAGVVIGVALYNKLLVVLIAGAVLLGLLVLGPRAELRKPWLWAGVALAVLIGSPNLIFQLTHGWPSMDVASALTEHNGTDNRITFVPFQLILLGPVLVPITVAGLIGLLRNRSLRALGVAYPVAAVVVLAAGGRPDYVVPLLLVLLAAGCVPLERWISGQPGRVRLLAAGLALNGLVTAVIALPLIPVSAVGSTPVPAISQLVRDSIGWPQLADQVAATHRSLPEPERANTVVLTGNYGEAGGIQRFRPELRVYSGQNHLYRAGPPPESARTVIVVGLDGASRLFATCTRVADIDNAFGVDNEEQGRHILLCRDPLQPWRDAWPRVLHYD